MQYDLIQYHARQYDLMRYDSIRYDTIWCNTIRFNMMWYNMIWWWSIAQKKLAGTLRRLNTLDNTMQCDTMQDGTVYYDLIRCSTVQYDMMYFRKFVSDPMTARVNASTASVTLTNNQPTSRTTHQQLDHHDNKLHSGAAHIPLQTFHISTLHILPNTPGQILISSH